VDSNLAALRVVSYQPESTGADEFGDSGRASGNLTAGTLPVVQAPSGMERRIRGFPEFARQTAIRNEMEQVAMGGREMALDADDFLVVGGGSGEQQQSMEVAVLPDQVDRIAEVSRYRFRFFDGVQWQATWDSALTGKLPLAVEFQMDLDAVDPDVWGQQSTNIAVPDQVSAVDQTRINAAESGSTSLKASNQASSTSRTGDRDSLAGQSRRDGVFSPPRSPTSPQSTTSQRFGLSGQSLESSEDRLTYRWLITIDATPSSTLADENAGGFGNSVRSEGRLP